MGSVGSTPRLKSGACSQASGVGQAAGLGRILLGGGLRRKPCAARREPDLLERVDLPRCPSAVMPAPDLPTWPRGRGSWLAARAVDGRDCCSDLPRHPAPGVRARPGRGAAPPWSLSGSTLSSSTPRTPERRVPVSLGRRLISRLRGRPLRWPSSGSRIPQVGRCSGRAQRRPIELLRVRTGVARTLPAVAPARTSISRWCPRPA